MDKTKIKKYLKFKLNINLNILKNNLIYYNNYNKFLKFIEKLKIKLYKKHKLNKIKVKIIKYIKKLLFNK